MAGIRALYLLSLETSVALVPISYNFTQAAILGVSSRTRNSYVEDKFNETASPNEGSTLPYVDTIKVMNDTRRLINKMNLSFQLTGAKLYFPNLYHIRRRDKRITNLFQTRSHDS